MAAERFAKIQELHRLNNKVYYDIGSSNECLLHFGDHKNNTNGVELSGSLDNFLSELFMGRLNTIGVETIFIKRLNMREQLVYLADPLNFGVKISNTASKEQSEHFDLLDSMRFEEPLIEFFYRSGDTERTISPQHIKSFQWLDADDLTELLATTKRINDFMVGQFLALGLNLNSYSLGFGRYFFYDIYESYKIILNDLSNFRVNVESLHSKEHQAKNTQNNFGMQELAKRFGVLSFLENMKVA